MKSVGLNVAMDPLMVVSLTGVAGGFVFLVADDPNCWSTQNEQDSRLLAYAAEIVCLEPASVQEAKDMVIYAYDLSEKLGRIVMIRTVTRLNHSRAPVKFGTIEKSKKNPIYIKQRAGFPALPKHKAIHKEQKFVKEAVNNCPFNKIELMPEAKIAVIAPGHAANYAREALGSLGLDGKISFLKIGVISPLPDNLIRSILIDHKIVIVFEEIEPLVENQIRSLWYETSCKCKVIGKLSGDLEIPGELTTEKAIEVLARFCNVQQRKISNVDHSALLVKRDTVLCAGCSHAGTFYAIKKAAKKGKTKTLISGDIGCYGLGVIPPYNLFDSHICMGASIGIGNGYAATGYKGPIICVIGDGTFYHSGIPALINAAYNQHNITVVILDNAIIGMTGHQPNPRTGLTAMGKPSQKFDIAQMVRACGVQHVKTVDSFQVKTAVKAINRAILSPGPSVVISEGECALMGGRKLKTKENQWLIDLNKCNACGVCVNFLYCPAIIKDKDSYAISRELCAGCGICAQICPKHAIIEAEPERRTYVQKKDV
jgi:indolepyruvate ferredoxin oxidoreductase alpha subunit